MVTSKKRWTKTATKLALTTAMSAFWMATTPAAAAVDPVSAARAAAFATPAGCQTTTGLMRIGAAWPSTASKSNRQSAPILTPNRARETQLVVPTRVR